MCLCDLLEYPIKTAFWIFYAHVSFRSHEVDGICVKCFCSFVCLSGLLPETQDFFMNISTSNVRLGEVFLNFYSGAFTWEL